MPRLSSASRWRELIAEFTRSGETIAAFCRRRDLKAPTFYMWRRRISTECASPRAPAPFLPIEVRPSAPAGSGVEVLLRNGRRLRLERGFDPRARMDRRGLPGAGRRADDPCPLRSDLHHEGPRGARDALPAGPAVDPSVDRAASRHLLPLAHWREASQQRRAARREAALEVVGGGLLSPRSPAHVRGDARGAKRPGHAHPRLPRALVDLDDGDVLRRPLAGGACQ